MEATRNGRTEKALAARDSTTREIMDMHRLLGHPSEQITRGTAKAADVALACEWRPCIGCSNAKAHHHAVPMTTDNRATERSERIFVDLGGAMHAPSLGGSNYVMIIVDDHTRLKVVKFLKKESDATSALRSFIADYITPEKLTIRAIRTDNGGEFEGDIDQVLDELGITHKHTPPDRPQYNGVAERALGLLREKTIVLMQDLKEGATDRLWAEAMNFACDMSDMSRTTSNEGGITPHERWHRSSPSLN